MTTTGPGKTEVRTNPASLMLFNFDIDGDALKVEHIMFLRREAIPKLRAGASVAVIGLTDRKGSVAHNKTLSEKRVARTIEFLRSEVPRLTVTQSTGFGEAVAAQEGDMDETLDDRFRSVLVFLTVPAVVTTIKVMEVTVKSFIATIGSNAGSIPGFTLVTPPPPAPPVPIPVSQQFLLETFAKATDAQFNEDPTNSAKNKGYRLFSSCRFTVVFEDGKILAATPAIPELDTDVGTEPPSGGLQPPDLIITPVSISPKGDNFVTFSWTAKGRPHLAAEPSFQAVQPRSCSFIWHFIRGRIDISSGTPIVTVALQGSKFPSHRVFINGAPVLAQTLMQGPLSGLWDADPGDSTKVR